jgi:hypothetical protein
VSGLVFAVQPNNAFDRTAGSHSLAAAGQRGRSAHEIDEASELLSSL